MSIIVIHDPLTAKLAAADSPIELRSPEGDLLGYFTPVKSPASQLTPPASEEELAARFAEGGGRPLTEILRDLEKRS